MFMFTNAFLSRRFIKRLNCLGIARALFADFANQNPLEALQNTSNLCSLRQTNYLNLLVMVNYSRIKSLQILIF